MMPIHMIIGLGNYREEDEKSVAELADTPACNTIIIDIVKTVVLPYTAIYIYTC